MSASKFAVGPDSGSGRRRPAGRASRICYVTSARGVAGAEELIAALVAGGRERGWEQSVLNPFALPGSIALAERCAPVHYEALGCSSIRRLPALRSWLDARLAELQPDIVHVMLFHASLLAATVPRRGERWLLTHVYGEGLGELRHPRVRARLDRWALRTFDHVAAISDAVDNFLTQQYACPPPPVGRIRLGWSGNPRARARSPERPPTVVCVATLRHEKGHPTLLAAFSEVCKVIPAARLVLIGDGPYRPQINALIQGARLEDNVHLAGRVEDIWPYLAEADVFALASPSEALGIAVMEAMAAGLPVVATDVGGIPEIVAPGVTGELFGVRDHRQLASKLIALLQSPERLDAMSAAALEAAENMRMDQSIEEYFNLYDRLIGGCEPTT